MFASALDSTAQFQDFLNFSFAYPGFTPHEAQRKEISDFGQLERFKAMFTVNDETDNMQKKNTPFKIAPLLLP